MKLSPLYIYRETNFPAAYIHPLLGELSMSYKRLLDQKSLLVEEISDLTSQMEAEIKLIQDDQIRRLAINFKRDLFNMRPSARAKFQSIQEMFSSKLKVLIHEVFLKQERLSQQRSEIQNSYEQAYGQEREWIQKVYQNDIELRNSLVLLNTSIFKNLETYLSTEASKHNRQVRKLDYVLSRFLTRSVMKTSPFANLTYSGIGVFNQVKLTGRKRLYPRVNDAILLRIFDQICLYPEIMKQLSYQLNDTLIEKEGKYYITVLKDGDKKKKLYKASQQLCMLPSNSSLVVLFDELNKARRLSYKQMLERLQKCGMEEEVTTQLIYYLIENGVLERSVYLNGQAEDMVEELLETLRLLEFNHPSIAQLHHLQRMLTDLEDGMNNFNTLEEVYQMIEEIMKHFDLQCERREMLYIDGIDEKREAQALSDDWYWKNALADYQWLTMAFDVSIKMRYYASQHFKQCYGMTWEPGSVQEISSMMRDLAQALFFDKDLYDTGRGRFKEESKYSHDKVNQLHSVARMLINHMKSKINDKEINLDHDIIKSAVNQLQCIIGNELISHSFFVQHTNEKIVLNHTYKGYGMFFARFLKYLSHSDREYDAYVRDCFEKNGIADIHNTFGFNANLRGSVVKQVFQLPIMTENGTKDALTWRDVGLSYNLNTSLLEFYEIKSRKRVRPQFLGTLTLLATPPILNVFDTLSSHGTLYFDFGEVLIQEYVQTGTIPPVMRIPRVAMSSGKLVLSRAKWLVRTEDLIKASGNDKGFETWGKILTYYMQHDIPLRFYLRPYAIDPSKTEGLSDRKPQFINLSSPLLFHLFMQIIDKNEYVLVEEELPIMHNDSSSVTEYIYEMTHNGGIENEQGVKNLAMLSL